ncbi:MAG: hypothetical protein KIS90_09330 [Phenylobacterium sp.]|nr:hypothetical protein [Phenylobacterium sp.]
MRLALAALAALFATSPAAQAPTPAPPPPSFEVTLKPSAMDQAAGTGFVDVTLKLPSFDAGAGAPLLTLPIVIANTDTVTNTMTGLVATDAEGAVPLVVRDDPAAIA